MIFLIQFQTGGLRQKLEELDRDFKIGKLSTESFVEQKLEICVALKRLNENLSTADSQFFDEHSTLSMRQFVQVSDSSTLEDGSKILSMAKKS